VEYSVIWQKLLTVNREILLIKLQFFLAFKEQQQVGSDPDRKQYIETKSDYFNAKYLPRLGNNKAWCSPGVDFRAITFFNLCK
jgi:hypothetical protein